MILLGVKKNKYVINHLTKVIYLRIHENKFEGNTLLGRVLTPFVQDFYMDCHGCIGIRSQFGDETDLIHR